MRPHLATDRSRSIRVLVPLGALVLALACGGDDPVDPTPTPTVATVVVSPATATFEAVGATTQLSAVARDAQGNAVSGTAFSWTSGDGSVATVSTTGLVTAAGNGQTQITATAGGVAGTATVTVSQVVVGVGVTPGEATVEVGGTVAFAAEAVDANDNPVAGASVAWSSSDEAVATVDAAGRATAHAAGEATITAESDGVTGTATLTVTEPPEVASVEVEPATASVQVGQSTTFTARALDGAGDPIPGIVFTWSSSDEAVATVDDAGEATGQAEGTATITATSGAFSASATLTVTAATQASLSLVSGDAQNGKTQQAFGAPLVVALTDGGGNPVAGATVTWAVTQGDARLSSATATTDAQGRASITVTSGRTTSDHVVQASSAGTTGGPISFSLRTTVMAVQIVDNAFVDVEGRQNADFRADIQVGDTIEFTYVVSGATTHTVTSTDTPPGGASFDSGTMNPGDTFRFAPAIAGTWTFFCAVHPGTMLNATIVVSAGGGSPARASGPDDA